MSLYDIVLPSKYLTVTAYMLGWFQSERRVKERPIIMQAESVKAILDGRKTQTRRVIKDQPQSHMDQCVPYLDDARFCWTGPQLSEEGNPLPREMWAGGWPDCSPEFYCPYGVPGDRLWVRETHWINKEEHLAAYRADAEMPGHMKGNKWRSPMFMPRWASRITLEITEVRVQRLQDISDPGDDLIAEGIRKQSPPDLKGNRWHWGDTSEDRCPTPTMAYMALWDKINRKKHPWASNPWVWAISFRRV